jgi:hypothetical protein
MHGTWIEIGFGTTVWKPAFTKRDWQPYSNGRWIFTDYGWYWDSYEIFGEIVYHYGRWFYDDFYGWLWIPDYEWAPAWVEWRYDDDYIGWAPLSPYAIFSIEIGIHFTYDYYVPYNHWNYVKYNHFCNDNVYNYYVPSKYKYRVHNKTKVRTNYSYSGGRVRNDGIDIDRVREHSGRNIEKKKIILVNDQRELTRERNSKNRDKEIKTYIANRDDISRDELKDIKIDRSQRKSSIDLTKIELGRNKTIDKTEVTNERKTVDTRDIIPKERDFTKLNNKERIPIVKTETKKEINSDRISERKNKQYVEDNQNRNAEIEKRNENIRNNAKIELQKTAMEEQKAKNNMIIKKTDQSRISNENNNGENVRKVEPKERTQKFEQSRTEQNTNNNRNVEVKSENRTSRTETKNNSVQDSRNNAGNQRSRTK